MTNFAASWLPPAHAKTQSRTYLPEPDGESRVSRL